MRLAALLACAHLGFAGSRLVLTLQAVNLQASTLLVGVLMSLMMVVPMFVAVPTGRWADRHGCFRPGLWGFAMLASAGLLAAAVPSLVVLAVASVMVGTGYMVAHVAISNGIGRAATAQTRSRAFGVLAIGFSISGLVGPMLAGLAVDHGGHRFAFGLLVAFPLVATLLMFFPGRLHEEPPQAVSAAFRRAGVIDLLRHAPLRAAFVVSGLVSMGWDLFAFLVPLHGLRIGLSASAIGLVMGAFGAGTFAVRLAIPWLMRVCDEWRVLCVALALTAACYVVFPFADSLALLLPLAFVLGVVLGCGQPLGMSLVHLTAPPARSGEAVGVRSTITSISQTVLPLLFGALGTAAGLLPVFWVTAAVLGVGSAAYARRRTGTEAGEGAAPVSASEPAPRKLG